MDHESVDTEHHSDQKLRHAVRQAVAPEKLVPEPRELLRVVPHFAVIAACVYLVGKTKPGPGLAMAIVLGHAYACLAFVAHDVAHGSVIKNRTARYLLELLLWAPLWVPPTLWRVLHNRTHHAHANTPADCDRVYLNGDADLDTKRTYLRWFSPLNGSLGIFNPLWLAHFATYILRNTLSLGLGAKLRIQAAQPTISIVERRRVVAEVVLLTGIHLGFLWWMWQGWWSIAVFEIVPIGVASTVLMMFIFTNHLAQPIVTRTNTLATTVTLRLPSWVSILYSRFNYHIEHHLFPAAPSRAYPDISGAIKRLAGR